MVEGGKHAGNVKLVGGCLCLDFTNTAGWHASERPHERLTSYADLLAWARHAGALSANDAEALRRQAGHRVSEAAVVLERAIALREALFRVFSALIGDGAPAASGLAALNAELARAPARRGVVWTGAGFSWSLPGEPSPPLESVLWPMVWSAADLLTSDALGRVKLCPGPGCGWLFLDTTRNRSRRWCAMEDCGNRAKARRHYERARVAKS